MNYNQAEFALRVSIRLTIEKIFKGEQIFDLNHLESNFYSDKPLMPSVTLRVEDESGNMILDTDPKYPATNRVIARQLNRNPIWSPPGGDGEYLIFPSEYNKTPDQRIYPIHVTLRVAEFDNSYVYHATVKAIYNQKPITLHFFRTITSQRKLFAELQWYILGVSFIGFLISLISGWMLSRSLLSPIRWITRTANSISTEKMNDRISSSQTKDEVSDLIDAFNRMIDRLQRGIDQQKKFVSDASHELRTPLTTIINYSDLLNRWGKEDQEILQESIEAISSEAQNMKSLIEKLLMIARIDMKRQSIEKEIIDFQKLLADTMTKFERSEHDHSIIFERNDSGSIFADKTLMIELLRIFLENAAKYTPSGGKIEVKSIRREKFLEVTISDTGIGIAEEDREKVFDRFYRVDLSRTKLDSSGKEIGGTGLGLSIAKWIMEIHGIQIEIDGELGIGTDFILKIPCV